MSKSKPKTAQASTNLAALPCRRCKRKHDLETIFDNCSGSLPEKHWVYFRCPNCRASAILHVSKRRVEIGDIDGAPGPCFIPIARIAVTDFKYWFTKAATIIIYAGREWNFQAR